jgi:menaquinone-dependent protoporphyrinogen oxidase
MRPPLFKDRSKLGVSEKCARQRASPRSFCAERPHTRKKASAGAARRVHNPAFSPWHQACIARAEESTTMNRVLVLYATVEGQSLKVAEHAMLSLRDKGLSVRILNVRDVRYPFSLTDYRAALLVAPVHASFHPREMVRFVSTHREQLAKMPARFLSLSLSQAGVELASATPKQRAASVAGVRHVTDLFCDATGFDPQRVIPIAGCLAYSKYGFLKRQVMRYIAMKAGGSTDTTRDHEYTNFANVEAAVDALCQEFMEHPGQPQARGAA